ncbi:helix-turn-helix transcriptional regulator [Bacillus sp. S4]|uniref:helix-turn-helix transcriptional regulator n=1 Tax=Bacillus TaxID=1386 RepID=UPI00349FCDA8
MYQVTSDKLRLIRALAGISQREFADIIKADKKSVSAWEVGKSRPNEDSVKKIVDFVGENDFMLLDSTVYALPMQEMMIRLKDRAEHRL